LNCLNLITLIFITRRWNNSSIKSLLVLSSPATIDISFTGRSNHSFSPSYVPRRKILSTAAVTGAAWILSLLLFGSWPMALFNQLSPFVEQAHNLWLGLWPLQVPVGLLLILLGIRRADERMLVSAGPSASPYAATSSLIGPWMAGVSFLKDWEA